MVCVRTAAPDGAGCPLTCYLVFRLLLRMSYELSHAGGCGPHCRFYTIVKDNCMAGLQTKSLTLSTRNPLVAFIIFFPRFFLRILLPPAGGCGTHRLHHSQGQLHGGAAHKEPHPLDSQPPRSVPLHTVWRTGNDRPSVQLHGRFLRAAAAEACGTVCSHESSAQGVGTT